MNPNTPILRQFSFDALRICGECHEQFVLGVDGVVMEGRDLCDKCAGVTRTVPGGHVILINDKPTVEVE